MYEQLFKLDREMDMEKYSLKDLALYFEKYDKYICRIRTEKRYIIFKFDVNAFPHLIGMQHAYKGKKNKNEYLGSTGLEKIKNGEIKYKDIMKGIKNSKSNITWTNIKNRIKYLPMFLNKINKTKLLIRDDELFCRRVFLRGDYFLYMNTHKNDFPILSIKNIGNNRNVIETFFVDNDLSLIGALQHEKIISIELLHPIKNKLIEI